MSGAAQRARVLAIGSTLLIGLLGSAAPAAAGPATLAADDSYSAQHTVPKRVTSPAAGLLANDTVADGGTLTVTGNTRPSHGSVTVVADGTFSYLPDFNYTGADSFTYTASDGLGGTSTATVDLTMTGGDLVPYGGPQTYYTHTNATLTISDVAAGLLGPFFDPEGQAVSITAHTDPTHGVAVVNADGTFSYTPAADYAGGDTFQITVSDGNGLTKTVTAWVSTTALTSQTISFDPASIGTIPVGSSVDLTTFATASGTAGVQADVWLPSATVCTLDVGFTILTGVAAGDCWIAVYGAGGGVFSTSPQTWAKLTIGKATPVITIDPISDRLLSAGSFALPAPSADSGQPVVVGSITTDVCTVSGLTVTLLTGGTCTIEGYVIADHDYTGRTLDSSFLVTDDSVETNPPAMSTPTVALAKGTHTAAPLRVAWFGIDDSGIAAYVVEVRSGTNPAAAWLPFYTGTATSRTAAFAPGIARTFRVKAQDIHGTWSGWTTGPSVTPGLISDTSTAIKYGPGWTKATRSGDWSNNEHQTTKTGRTASYAFTGKGIALVAPVRSSGGGAATIYIDNVLRGTVSFAAAKSNTRCVLFTYGFLTSGKHTIRLVTTKAGRLAAIDGFIVLR